MHAAVGRVVTADWGQAFINPAIGRCHEENLVWAFGDAAGLDAPAIAAHADRLLGGAGLTHRRIVLEDGTADALRNRFTALGYDSGATVWMAHDGTAPEAPPVGVDEVSIELLVAAEERYLATDPATEYARDDEVRAHIVEHHRSYGASAAERRFAVVRDGAVAAWAKLWTRDGVAQVEDVVCLAGHRGRGYGRAVVAAATRAALEAEPALLFIVADADDWPQQLYSRLGYAPVGRTVAFVKGGPAVG